MADNNEDERNRKLKEFSDSLRQPISQRYFEEDDLAFIFDLAHDAGDYYLMNEALFLGARLYPESDMLQQRKALYYKHEDDGDVTLRRHMANNASCSGIIWDLLRIHADGISGKEADSRLKLILDSAETLDDEEVIQFCTTATDLDRQEFLIKNLDHLRIKAQYLPTLLYEMAIIADENGDTDLALKLCNELIETEPYNLSFWILYGETALGNDDIEKAREASELAVAIDPEDEDAMSLKLRTLRAAYPMERTPADYARICVKRHPESIKIVPLALEIMLDYQRNTEASAVASAFFRKHPDNAGAAFFMLLHTFASEKRVVKAFIEARRDMPDNREVVAGWVEKLNAAGFYSRAITAWDTFVKLTGDPKPYTSAYLFALYCCRNFELITASLSANNQSRHEEAISPLTVWIQIHALLITGHAGEAMAVFGMLPPLQPDGDMMMTGEERFKYFALLKLIDEVKSILAKGTKQDWLKFDPLKVWHDFPGPDLFPSGENFPPNGL